MLAVAALAATGCGGDGSKRSAGEPAATGPTAAEGTTGPETTTQARKRTAPPPTLKRKHGKRKPRGAAELNRVERYLRDTYGGVNGSKASWYDHVTHISVSGETTTLRTDLGTDRRGKRLAREICQSVIGSVPGSTDVVRVTGPGDRLIEKCVP